MTINIFANDKAGTGNVLEAGFDDFIISEGTAGLNNQTVFNQQMVVYPNPFNKSLLVKINAENLTPHSSLSLIDLSGRTIYSTLINASTMELNVPEEIAKGIYILKADQF